MATRITPVTPSPLLEQTLIIFKPEAVKRGCVFEILRRFARKGLWLNDFQKMTLSKTVLQSHYRDLVKEKPAIAKKVIEYMASYPVYLGVVEGINAVNATIQLTGEKTDPNQCHPGTIRFDYSSDTYAAADTESRSLYNLIHRSDGITSAKREVALWLPEIKKIQQIEKSTSHSSFFHDVKKSMHRTSLDTFERILIIAVLAGLSCMAVIVVLVLIL